MKLEASEADSMAFEIRTLSFFFNEFIELIHGQALQGYPGVQVGTTVQYT